MAVDEGFQYAIPVPHPSSSIALTPPRKSDGPEVLATLNDQRVYMNLIGPPYPYTQKDWEEWYSFISYAALECSRELQAIQHLRQTSGAGDSEIDSQRTRWVSQPMWPSTIRELPEPNSSSDTGRFIGAITVERGQFLYVLDDRERQRWKRENDSLAAGDPKIIWEVGFYLSPDRQGRGIMPAVLRTMMDQVLIPYMNAHILVATYLEYNTPSRRVFERCGFDFVQFVPDAVELPPAKAGGATGSKVGLGFMRWQRA